MAALGLMSFVSKHTSWTPLQNVGRNINIGRGDAYFPKPNRTANFANAVGNSPANFANPVGNMASNPLGQGQRYPTQPTGVGYTQPTSFVAAAQQNPPPNFQQSWQPATYVQPAQQLTGPQVVSKHGGMVEDPRTVQVRTIGNRLASSVQNLQPGAMRFYLLKDNVSPQAYTIADGSVLITSALYSGLRSEGDLAAILSQRITEYIYRGYDVRNNTQVAQFRTQMLSAAGFDPRVIMDYESARSASQIASGGVIPR